MWGYIEHSHHLFCWLICFGVHCELSQVEDLACFCSSSFNPLLLPNSNNLGNGMFSLGPFSFLENSGFLLLSEYLMRSSCGELLGNCPLIITGCDYFSDRGTPLENRTTVISNKNHIQISSDVWLTTSHLPIESGRINLLFVLRGLCFTNLSFPGYQSLFSSIRSS